LAIYLYYFSPDFLLTCMYLKFCRCHRIMMHQNWKEPQRSPVPSNLVKTQMLRQSQRGGAAKGQSSAIDMWMSHPSEGCCLPRLKTVTSYGVLLEEDGGLKFQELKWSLLSDNWNFISVFLCIGCFPLNVNFIYYINKYCVESFK
jgi:hypothetical protein